MAKIKAIVNAMDLADLQPDAPDSVAAEEEPELTKPKIEAIAKKLQQPWLYGTALHRFASREDVTLKQIRRIRKAINARLRAEAEVAIAALLEAEPK